ncbi:MAG: NAD(P)/FAD-dependent oxidoreductase [Saprospiraceae bacterium]|nr:NAD(P)/FAD-dependent oxidoreductase [Saprospiraceae bacterium]
MLQIPETRKKRVVILGAGFGGLTVAKKLDQKKHQIVIIDRNNYHQFQPLFYQVAMAGLEPSSISFPLRKAFQNKKDVVIRVAEVISVDPIQKKVETSEGECTYDVLILALGATTNFYGNEQFAKHTYGLKSISEALQLRNDLFKDLESAILERDYEKRQGYVDITIVGGGATGVEVAGALAELKNYIFPKDYTELDYREVDIYLIQSGDKLLQGMSEKSSIAAEEFLTKMGVHVIKNTKVVEVVGDEVTLGTGQKIKSRKVVWAAGITCVKIAGLPEQLYTSGNRIKVNDQLQIIDNKDVYVVGDQALLQSEIFPKGHPQVAQVAIQMANQLSKNLNQSTSKPFVYKDRGSMATIGRNKAVVDLPRFHFHGFFAWLVWLVVHLFALIGAKNKVFVFINWVWNYFTFDQSLRIILKADTKNQ